MLPPNDILTHTHKGGIEGLHNTYSRKKFRKSLKFPAAISFCIYIFIFLNTENYYVIIESIMDLVFTITPSLLGFMLGGYAILIGFGNREFLQSISQISDNKPISFYQKFSSTFAFSILSMAVVLIIACIFFLFSLIIPLDYFSDYLDYFNIFAIIILVFLLVYSICQIFIAILNVFTLSQAYHAFLIKKNFNETKTQINSNEEKISAQEVDKIDKN